MRDDPGQLLWEVGSNCSSSSTTTRLILQDVWLTSATTAQDNNRLGGTGVGAEGGGGIVGVDLDCWNVPEEGALGSRLEHADKINNNIFIGDGAGALLGGGVEEEALLIPPPPLLEVGDNLGRLVEGGGTLDDHLLQGAIDKPTEGDKLNGLGLDSLLMEVDGGSIVSSMSMSSAFNILEENGIFLEEEVTECLKEQEKEKEEGKTVTVDRDEGDNDKALGNKKNEKSSSPGQSKDRAAKKREVLIRCHPNLQSKSQPLPFTKCKLILKDGLDMADDSENDDDDYNNGDDNGEGRIGWYWNGEDYIFYDSVRKCDQKRVLAQLKEDNKLIRSFSKYNDNGTKKGKKRKPRRRKRRVKDYDWNAATKRRKKKKPIMKPTLSPLPLPVMYSEDVVQVTGVPVGESEGMETETDLALDLETIVPQAVILKDQEEDQKGLDDEDEEEFDNGNCTGDDIDSEQDDEDDDRMSITSGSSSDSLFEPVTRRKDLTNMMRCLVCAKAFKNLERLQAHTRIHTGEKPYRCDKCGDRFIDLRILEYHKEHAYHSGEEIYEDSPVPTTTLSSMVSYKSVPTPSTSKGGTSTNSFYFEQYMKRIAEQSAKSEQMNKVQKPIVLKEIKINIEKIEVPEKYWKRLRNGEFKNSAALLDEIVNHNTMAEHVETKKTTKTQTVSSCRLPEGFVCPYCQFSFKTDSEIINHLKLHNVEVEEKKKKVLSPSKDNVLKSFETINAVTGSQTTHDDSQKRRSRKQDLVRSAGRMYGGGSGGSTKDEDLNMFSNFKSAIQTPTNLVEISQNIIIAENTQVEAETQKTTRRISSRMDPSITQRKRHASAKSLDLEKRRIFECATCKHSFTRQSNLDFHMRSCHSNGKIYSCKACSDSFQDFLSLRLHQKIAHHSGERNKSGFSLKHAKRIQHSRFVNARVHSVNVKPKPTTTISTVSKAKNNRRVATFSSRRRKRNHRRNSNQLKLANRRSEISSSYKCTDCTRIVISLSGMKYHLIHAHDYPSKGLLSYIKLNCIGKQEKLPPKKVVNTVSSNSAPFSLIRPCEVRLVRCDHILTEGQKFELLDV